MCRRIYGKGKKLSRISASSRIDFSRVLTDVPNANGFARPTSIGILTANDDDGGDCGGHR